MDLKNCNKAQKTDFWKYPQGYPAQTKWKLQELSSILKTMPQSIKYKTEEHLAH